MNISDEAKKPELVWHYTDTNALISIIENHRLWASSAAFMNDTNEMQTRHRAFCRTYAQIRSSLKTTQQEELDKVYHHDAPAIGSQPQFLLSASESADALTLWRSYGSTDSVFSIGLDTSVELKVIPQLKETSHPDPPTGYFEEFEDVHEDGYTYVMCNPDIEHDDVSQWSKVKYVPRSGDVAHEEHLRNLAARALVKNTNSIRIPPSASSGSNNSRALANLEKDQSFADEREVRIIAIINPEWKFVKYRSGPQGLTPYIELGTIHEQSIGKLPIRQIMIGPNSVNTENQKVSLRSLLDSNGYSEVQILVSEIPYR